MRDVLRRIGCPDSQIITVAKFNALPTNHFADLNSDVQLMTFLRDSPFKTLLDVSAHFAESPLLTKSDSDNTEIDCICVNNLPPIKENIYTHIYNNLSECRFKHYDAALISANSSADFDKAFFTLEHHADSAIIFAKHNSEVSNHIRATLHSYSKVESLQNAVGEWLICHYHKPSEDLAVYVVTHKSLPPEFADNFPKDYKLIHAGRANSPDLGYPGDNTGDNISHMNPFINEITALYWIWKNTHHTIIGLAHYRRFFTPNNNDFLTHQQISEILNNHDIIVTSFYSEMLQIEYVENDCEELANIGETILRKNLLAAQPDYLDVFDAVMNSTLFYRCNMFITRRYIFDAYCKWLFSFLIDAVHDALRVLGLSNMSPPKQRLMGYFSERMLTVWLTKNRLRVKELNIIEFRGL